MKIFLGSTSLLKKNAVETILNQLVKKITMLRDYFVVLKEMDNAMPSTPFGRETYQGGKYRALQLYINYKNEGDFFVGLESGLIKRFQKLYEECWCVIINNRGKQYFGYSSGLMVPQKIIKKMKKGDKHAEIITQINKHRAINHRETWAHYSHGFIKRQESLQEAFRNAFLSAFLGSDLS